MKNNFIFNGFAACLIAVTFTACNKKADSDATPVPATNAPSATTMDTATNVTAAVVDTTAQAATQAGAMATAAATNVTAVVNSVTTSTGVAMPAVPADAPMAVPAVPATPAMPAVPAPVPAPVTVDAAAAAVSTNSASATFTDVIASAKQDLAAKNYQGTLDDLKKLSDVQLTPDQQKIVDDLKTEAQKLLSGGASSMMDAAKGMLGK